MSDEELTRILDIGIATPLESRSMARELIAAREVVETAKQYFGVITNHPKDCDTPVCRELRNYDEATL
jgi:hypothetical protein